MTEASAEEILKDEVALRKLSDEVFTKYDKDSNGYLDRSELLAMLEEIGQKVGEVPKEHEVNAIYEDLDVNQDGKISREEFVAMVRGVLENIGKHVL